MTFAQLKATGRESGLMIRARIEGCPIDFVTHPSMVALTPVAGRTRRHGLSFAGQKITQKVDLAKCTVEASGWSLKITDHSQVAAVLFACEPEETWMTAGTLDDIGTTLVVASTAGFDASGYLWIDTECMSYSSLGTTVDADGVTRGTFLGLGRGALGTLAQYHYSAGDASSGRNLRFPSVTNRPATFEGRRVELYAYGRGDDPQGTGTQFNIGIVLRDPRMSGAEWSISCDPITRILDAELGGDLGDCRPRGIYFPGTPGVDSPEFFVLLLRTANSGGASTSIPTFPFDLWTADTVTLPHASEVSATNPNGGFFESQQDFCDAVNRQLSTICATWGTQIECRPSDDGRYHFALLPTSSPDGVVPVVVVGDGSGGARGSANRNEPLFDQRGICASPAGLDGTVVVVQGTSPLYCHPSGSSAPDLGTVPRGALELTTWYNTVDISPSTARVMHLDGTIAPTSDMTVAQVEWPDSTQTYAIEGVDSTRRTMTLARTRENPESYLTATRYYTSATLPTIKIGRLYEYDSSLQLGTYQVLKSIETTCQEYVNLGVMPVIRAGDWTGAVFGEWFGQYVAAPTVAAFRRYTSFKPQKLLDYITPDLQLLGAFLAFDTIGRLTIKRLRPVLATEVPALRITAFLKDSWPSYERSPFGSINTWVLQDGYDPIEDKSTGIPFVVRDVTAYGRNPTPRALSVKPKSIYYGPTTTYEDAADAAQPLLSIYASPYVIVTGSMPLTALDTVLGSAVSVATSLLPGSAGLRGMSAVGMVTSREIDLYGGTIELEILISLSGAVGYAPSALITTQTDEGGGAWDITLSADYFRPGETAADHFLDGDSIKVYPFDALPGAGAAYSGTVASGGVGNVVPVVLDGVAIDDATNLLPAPGSVTWGGASNVTITTGQSDPLAGTAAVLLDGTGGAAEDLARSDLVAYVGNSPTRSEVWIEKDAAALNFAGVELRAGGVGSGFVAGGVYAHLGTGECVTYGTGYSDAECVEALTGWWRVRFSQSGLGGTTLSMRVRPSAGLAANFPTADVAATGPATVYAPRMVYLAWVPGATEWALAFDAAGTTSANMKRYGWLADEDLRIDFTTDPDRAAFKFSSSG